MIRLFYVEKNGRAIT